MLNNKLSLNTFIFILAIIASLEVIGLFCSPAPPPQYNQEKTQQEDYTPGHTVSLSLFMPLFTNTKQGLHCIFDWIDTNSDIVMALATIAIALFTFTLWQTSQEHSRHMEASIAVAQKAADAAKKSADALPAIERAYLFVEVTMGNPDPEGIAGTIDNAPQYNSDNVKIIVTNHGKTPAIITAHPYTTEVLMNYEIDDKITIFSSNDIDALVPFGPVIINSTDPPKRFPAPFFMTKEKWRQITINKAFLACIGCLHYQDIFGKPHETIFCWKYEQFSGFHYDKDPNRNKRT